MALNLTINYKDKQLAITADDEKTIKWIKEEIQKQTKIPVLQQELSYVGGDGKKVLTDNEMPLKIAKLPINILSVKNLGKQIRWEMVFYIEYLGPIIILPLFYLLGKRESYSDAQTVGLVLGVLHYLKREYETAFVHVFSR
jgi:very-long-chain enoyl-CoA reductase